MIQLEQVDTSGYEKAVGALADAVGVASVGSNGDGGRAFLKKQAGLLVKELVAVAPPVNVAQSKKKAVRRVNHAFLPAPKDAWTGANAVWLWSDSNTLYGVDRDYDQRGASVDDSMKLLFSGLAKKSREAGKHGKQTVRMYQRWLVEYRTLKKLATEVAGRFGRLKASFLPAWDALQPTGTVPSWIAKHRSGARGGYQGNLNVTNEPHVIISSHAKGIDRAKPLIQKALTNRVAKMAIDAKLYISGVKSKFRI